MPRTLILIAVLMSSLAGCSSPTYQRGSDDPGIDEAALSTRLDRVDLDRALDQWYEQFQASKFYLDVPAENRRVAVLEIDNDTSEFIGSALRNLIESVETQLVNGGVFDVLSNDEIARDAIMEERLRSLGDAVDPETVAALGRELGVHYFVHGRVGETAEKTQDRKRIQYFLFLKVTEVATTRIVFQQRIPITKQIQG